MSNNVSPISVFNQPINKASKAAKIFAPLVIGSTLAFGGKVNATETEKPLPEASKATAVQVEKSVSEAPQIVKADIDFRLPVGYILGATMGHLLQRRRDKEEINTLEQEVKRLKKL